MSEVRFPKADIVEQSSGEFLVPLQRGAAQLGDLGFARGQSPPEQLRSRDRNRGGHHAPTDNMHTARLQDCLQRLIPHVDNSRIALTGGVAIEWHLACRGAGRRRISQSADIDFVVEGPDVVRESVTSEFLVSHFHQPQFGQSKFLLQLADPVTRTRLDFFPDSLPALPRACVAEVAAVRLLVVQLDDILDHKLATLAKATEADPVDAKHFADAQLLGDICARHVPSAPANKLSVTTYSQEIGGVCSRCESSRHAGFPLAQKHLILETLGYV